MMAITLASKICVIPPVLGGGQQCHGSRTQQPTSQLAPADSSSCGWKSVSFGGGGGSLWPLVRLAHQNRARQDGGVTVQAAWTRRSKGPLAPPSGHKSWKQRHEKFLKPFMLDVFISNKYVHAKVVHRLTSRVVSVATSNARDLRFSLYSLCDENACKVIGKLLAERSIEADVFAVTFNLRKGERFEGKLALVVNTLVENGVALV